MSRNIYGEAKRNHRIYGGKRTIKNRARVGSPRAQRRIRTLTQFPFPTSAHYRAGDGNRR